MRLTAEQVVDIIGYDPITLSWNKGEELTAEPEFVTNEKLRLTIQSDVEGHPVTLYVYDSDLDLLDDNGRVVSPASRMEIGLFQWLIDTLHDHSALAPFRKREGAASSNASDAQASNQGWICPTHGKESIFKANFGEGLQCSKYEIATSFAAPEWANSPQPKLIKGENRWYCKHREIALPPRK